MMRSVKKGKESNIDQSRPVLLNLNLSMRNILLYSPDEAFVKLCADRGIHSLDRMNKKMNNGDPFKSLGNKL